MLLNVCWFQKTHGFRNRAVETLSGQICKIYASTIDVLKAIAKEVAHRLKNFFLLSIISMTVRNSYIP